MGCGMGYYCSLTTQAAWEGWQQATKEILEAANAEE